MEYLLLIAVIAFTTAQTVIQKQFNIKVQKPNVFLFSGVMSFAAMLFFVVSSGFKLSFSMEFLPYSVGMGIAFASALIGNVYAIRYGSLAISNLVISYSLLIPTMYGVIILGDDVSTMAYVGVVLLLVSIFLLNAKKGEMKFSLKWIIGALLAFFGNGMCSTVQKMEQLKFEGGYKNEFMIVALIIASVALFIMAALQKDKGDKKCFTECLKLGGVNGIINGMTNLFVMFLTGLIPNVVLYPSISAGGIVLSFIIAVFVYKEKLHKVQYVGYVLGTLSVIFLNFIKG